MYEEDYYEQFEPMPKQLEEIESLVSGYAKEVGKELVAEIERLKSTNKAKDEKIKALREYEYKCQKLRKDLESKYKKYSKDCAMEYLSNEAGLDGIVYGDTVYIVDKESFKKPCNRCDKGKINVTFAKEELTIKCDKCHGNTYFYDYSYYIKEVKVVGFKVEPLKNEDGCDYNLSTILALSDGSKDKNGFIEARNCHHDDLNSSNYYPGWYKTKEDAIKYCKEEVKEK